MTVIPAGAGEGAPLVNRRLTWASVSRWFRAANVPPSADQLCSHAPPKPVEPHGRRPRSAPSHDATVAPHLLNAYVASTFEVALQAEALAAGAERLDLAPVDLNEVMDRVAAVLTPLAAAQGVRLLNDSGARAISLPQGDARRLHSVLFHLLARALAGEEPGGHVRILTASSSREVCVRILIRSPETAAGRTARTCRDDLSAAQRILRAMGGALVLEPRRAGYQPLCLVLGRPPSAAALRAA